MLSKRLIFLLTIVLLCSSLSAQSIIKEHSAKKASIYSAIVPGMGQFYNKKYWKIPLIYAALGSAFYAAQWNRSEYEHYLLAYRYRTDENESTVDPYVNRYTESNLITIKDYYRKNKDLAYIISAGLYLINILDASVDAHLFDFEVSDDISLVVQPEMINNNYQAILGISLTLNWH